MGMGFLKTNGHGTAAIQSGLPCEETGNAGLCGFFNRLCLFFNDRSVNLGLRSDTGVHEVAVLTSVAIR